MIALFHFRSGKFGLLVSLSTATICKIIPPAMPKCIADQKVHDFVGRNRFAFLNNGRFNFWLECDQGWNKNER